MKKKDENSNTIRYKARLITQGFSQKPGTFAPIMRFESLHTAFGMAAIHGWDMRQMDIKTAYLNGYLEEEIYMVQPSVDWPLVRFGPGSTPFSQNLNMHPRCGSPSGMNLHLNLWVWVHQVWFARFGFMVLNFGERSTLHRCQS